MVHAAWAVLLLVAVLEMLVPAALVFSLFLMSVVAHLVGLLVGVGALVAFGKAEAGEVLVLELGFSAYYVETLVL